MVCRKFSPLQSGINRHPDETAMTEDEGFLGGVGLCFGCFSCFFALNQCFPWRAVHFLFSWKLFEWISPNCLIKRAADRKIKEPSKSSAESACLTWSAVLSISQSSDDKEGMISLKGRKQKGVVFSEQQCPMKTPQRDIKHRKPPSCQTESGNCGEIS